MEFLKVIYNLNKRITTSFLQYIFAFPLPFHRDKLGFLSKLLGKYFWSYSRNHWIVALFSKKMLIFLIHPSKFTNHPLNLHCSYLICLFLLENYFRNTFLFALSFNLIQCFPLTVYLTSCAKKKKKKKKLKQTKTNHNCGPQFGPPSFSLSDGQGPFRPLSGRPFPPVAMVSRGTQGQRPPCNWGVGGTGHPGWVLCFCYSGPCKTWCECVLAC